MTIEQIKNALDLYPHNPALIQRAVISALEQRQGGERYQAEFIDPNNPFCLLIETACVLTSGAITHDHDLNRRQYAAAAMTESDIYYHMSDRDYIGIFALPSRASFKLIFDLDDIRNKMVDDDELGIRKLVVPRDTFVTVADAEFTMEYPIEIRELQHGGIQVVYDLSIKSPLHIQETNLLDWEIIHNYENEHQRSYLSITVPMYQFKVRSVVQGITLAAPVELSIPLEDDFYFARVYYENRNGDWVEMTTTHNPDIYNPDTPTAVLRVYQNELQVKVPRIYNVEGLVDNNIRVDIYETKGDLSIDLQTYQDTDYKVAYHALDPKRDLNDFTAPMDTLSFLICYSQDITTGGRGPLDFEELKYRVKMNTYGPRDVPISNVQIETQLIDEGYNIIKNVDTVTNRIYYASKALPAPLNEKLITAASASIETLLESPENILAFAYANDHKHSLTILPDTLYEDKQGTISIVPKSTVERLKVLPPEILIGEVNRKNYFFSPFHYVLDFANNRFDLRAYYLDKPSTSIKMFEDINNTTLMDVSIDSYEIEKVKQGYRILLKTKSGNSFKDLDDEKVYVTMMFKSRGERDYAYLNGEMVAKDPNTKERIFEFILETKYNVNRFDDLILDNFKMYNDDKRHVPIRLLEDIEVVFSTSAKLGPQYRDHKLNHRLPKWMLPDGIKAIISEKIRIKFGVALNALWKQARSVTSTAKYLRYDQDVLAVYEHDVIDQTTNFSGVSVSGNQLTIRYKHRKGDPVLDSTGQQIVRHRKGDVVLDSAGKPIIAEPRKLMRQIDIMLVEAPYYFATDVIATDYKQEMIDTYVDWISDGLESINKRVLEQTKIYFYPDAALGQIEIVYDNSTRARIDAAQSLNVELVVNKNVYADNALKESIRLSTIRVIDQMLGLGTISTSDILRRLSETYGDDVIGIQLNGLGGRDDVIAMTVIEDTKRCSLKKRLTIRNDQKLMVEEAVSIQFSRHDINQIKENK